MRARVVAVSLLSTTVDTQATQVSTFGDIPRLLCAACAPRSLALECVLQRQTYKITRKDFR